MPTISEAFALALEHHQAGRLQMAEQIYWQILKADPNQAEVLHLIGVLAYQVGKHELAVDYMGQAIRLDGNQPHFHCNLGSALQALGTRCGGAGLLPAGRETASRTMPRATTTWEPSCKTRDRAPRRSPATSAPFRLKPDYAEAHNNLGSALQGQEKVAEATGLLPAGLATEAPTMPRPTTTWVRAWQDQGKIAEAIACYRRALELKPDLCRGPQ